MLSKGKLNRLGQGFAMMWLQALLGPRPGYTGITRFQAHSGC